MKRLLSKSIKSKLIILKDILSFLYGVIEYKISRKPYNCRTSQKTNIALVNLFCYTGGKSNDFLSMIINWKRKKLKLPNSSGVLGDLSNTDLERISRSLYENGYYVFPKKLPNHMIESLLNTATQSKFLLNFTDEEEEIGGAVQREEFYDPKNLKSTRYLLDNNLCVNNPTIQEIYSDYSILSVAQAYLKSVPKLDVLGLWWNTKYSEKPSKAAAEYFHFDLDRPKWLKFFIYLTDVDENNGPHQFVKGSHSSGGIPKELLKKGYSRLSDDEILSHFSKENIIKFIAERGTIIAEDTRGLHKASKVINKDRLLLQVQFSNSLFGTAVPSAKISKMCANNLKYLINIYPEVFALYVR